MRTRLLIFDAPLHLSLLGSSAAASESIQLRQAQALWLSGQLHHSVEPRRSSSPPRPTALEGCTIIRTHAAPLGATALSLRCPGPCFAATGAAQTSYRRMPAARPRIAYCSILADVTPEAPSPKIPPDRAGRGRTAGRLAHRSLHAELPVVALDSGVAGAEIRVRIASSNRVLRARILTAHAVTIVAAGA